ncbi:MAG: hypothetical protein IT211_06985 [Armatimonadetes bacterium]|nr:hypothetical protein [Armatimonadota bacterium]
MNNQQRNIATGKNGIGTYLLNVCFVICMGIMLGTAIAQSQEIRWENTYIEPDPDPHVSELYYNGMEFVQDTNGDIYIWGITGAGFTSAVSRIDEHGALFWSRKFGNPDSTRCNIRRIKVVDSTLLVSASFSPRFELEYGNHLKIILSRNAIVLDSFISRQFQVPGKSYGLDGNSHLCQAPNPNEFIAISTSEYIATWFQRIADDGYQLQEKQHHKDVRPYYEAVGVTPVAHNRFILRGDRTDDLRQFRRPFLVCFDSSGDILWERMPADTAIAYTYCAGLSTTSDGGMLLNVIPLIKTGKQWASAPLLFRLDSLGNTLWKKELVFETDLAWLNMIERLPDGGFMAVGYTAMFRPNSRAIIES